MNYFFNRVVLCVSLVGLTAQMTVRAEPFYESSIKFPIAIGTTIGLGKLCYDGAIGFAVFLDYIVQKMSKKPVAMPKPTIKVALMKIDGEIENVNSYVKQLELCAQDDAIQGVIVNIESGGGNPGSAAFLYNEFLHFTQRKPLIVLTGSDCCSAAYYIACGADRIICSHSAIVGHIGICRLMTYFPETVKGSTLINGVSLKGQIKHGFIKAGKYKVAGNYFNDLIQEEREYLQALTNEHYDIFCAVVAERRNMNLEEKDVWADGKQFSAPRALSLGLVDQIGSFFEAKETIKSLIKERNSEIIGEIEIIELAHS